jgi:hypothetical protein
VVPDRPLTRQRVERLRPVLEQFLPIHARAVVILAPRAEIELVYPPGADIGEKYLDKYPVVEFYTGLGDSTAVLPDWVLFLSATLDNLPGDHVSADPAAPTTLRFRTYAPPAK